MKCFKKESSEIQTPYWQVKFCFICFVSIFFLLRGICFEYTYLFYVEN